MLEEMFQIIAPRKAFAHVDIVHDPSLQQVPQPFLLHIPAHEDIHVHSEDDVDEEGEEGGLGFYCEDFIEEVELEALIIHVFLEHDSAFDGLCGVLLVVQLEYDGDNWVFLRVTVVKAFLWDLDDEFIVKDE